MSKKVLDQVITKRYAIYHGDCCEVLPGIPNNSVGFSIFSPPFVSLFSYTESKADLGNSKNYAEFFRHFDYLLSELARTLMPGRSVAVHCMDLLSYKNREGYIGLRDFSGDLIKAFAAHKFLYHTRITIWKDPLTEAVRSNAIGLAHKQLVKDSSICRTGLPDYLLVFRKPGDNPKPIQHPKGLMNYAGFRSVPSELKFNPEQGKNKRGHWIWQQYASPVWMDVRQMRVLPHQNAKDADDEKHVCPLQRDVVERALVLWSNPDDTVLTPFMGIGTEVYCSVEAGRRGVGIELKKSYFRMAKRNLERLERRVARGERKGMFQ